MKKGKVVELYSPEVSKDLLTEKAREGAQQMLKMALEEEIQAFIEQHEADRLKDGC